MLATAIRLGYRRVPPNMVPALEQTSSSWMTRSSAAIWPSPPSTSDNNRVTYEGFAVPLAYHHISIEPNHLRATLTISLLTRSNGTSTDFLFSSLDSRPNRWKDPPGIHSGTYLRNGNRLTRKRDDWVPWETLVRSFSMLERRGSEAVVVGESW